MKRVSIPAHAHDALLALASLCCCMCGTTYMRDHDGVCLSCWALQRRLVSLRRLLAIREETPGCRVIESLYERANELDAELRRRREVDP